MKTTTPPGHLLTGATQAFRDLKVLASLRCQQDNLTALGQPLGSQRAAYLLLQPAFKFFGEGDDWSNAHSRILQHHR
jgi:hypothetical protein